MENNQPKTQPQEDQFSAEAYEQVVTAVNEAKAVVLAAREAKRVHDRNYAKAMALLNAALEQRDKKIMDDPRESPSAIALDADITRVRVTQIRGQDGSRHMTDESRRLVGMLHGGGGKKKCAEVGKEDIAA